MAKKITIAEKFAKVEAILTEKGETELAEFIAERAEMHTKKSANRKPTAVQKANAELGDTIIEHLQESGAKMTVTAMIKTIPECADLSNQKVSAILRGLVENGKVEKETVKGQSFFFVA